MENCGIYKIVNIINGKFYIGSSRAIPSRWKAHRYALRKGTHKNYKLQDDWNLYGEDAFSWTILYDGLTLEDARLKEEEILEPLMNEQDSVYNLCFDAKGRLLSDSSRQKISESLKGRVFSQEHREKIGRALIGRPYSEETRSKIGKASSKRRHSEKTKQQIREAQLGKRKGAYRNSDQTIYHFRNTKTEIEECCTTYELRIKYNLRPESVARLANGKVRTHRGWVLTGIQA